MKLLTLAIKPIMTWLLVCLALYCFFVTAANEDETSNNRVEASSSSSVSSSQHSSPQSTPEERIFANADDLRVPEVQATAATAQQRFDAFTRLSHRLVEHGSRSQNPTRQSPTQHHCHPSPPTSESVAAAHQRQPDAIFLDVSPIVKDAFWPFRTRGTPIGN